MITSLTMSHQKTLLKEKYTISTVNWLLISILVPILILALVFRGLGMLIPVVVVLISGLLTKFLLSRFTIDSVDKNGSVILWLVLCAFLVNQDTSILAIALASSATVLLSTKVFGGVGGIFINPVALFGLLYFVSRGFASEGAVTAFTIVRSLGDSDSGMMVRLLQELRISESVSILADFINTWILAPIRLKVPEGYFELAGGFWGTSPLQGISPIFYLASIPLLGMGILKWGMITVYLGSYMVLSAVFGDLTYSGQWFAGDVLFHLLTGMFPFVLFFVLPLQGSLPASRGGQWLYGGLAAVSGFLFRMFFLSQDGLFLGVLIANVLTPVINELMRKRVKNSTK